MNTDKYLLHNGDFLPDDAPVFTVHNRIRYGDGVFDTLLSDKGDLKYVEKHYERLKAHAAVLGISFPLSFETFRNAVIELLEKNGEQNIKIAVNTILTRGLSSRGLKIPDNMEPDLIIRTSPLPDEFPPIRAVIAKTVRRNEGSPLSRIKSLNYGDNILALRESASQDANEAIMLNNQGYVTCATVGNVFAVIDDTLITPPLSDGVMDGILRAHMLEFCGAIERSLTESDLLSAKTAYITNSMRGAVPIQSLNGKTLETEKYHHF